MTLLDTKFSYFPRYHLSSTDSSRRGRGVTVAQVLKIYWFTPSSKSMYAPDCSFTPSWLKDKTKWTLYPLAKMHHFRLNTFPVLPVFFLVYKTSRDQGRSTRNTCGSLIGSRPHLLFLSSVTAHWVINKH